MLGVDLRLEEDVHEEVPTHLAYLLHPVLDCNRPEGVQSEQILEVLKVNDAEDASLDVEIDVSLFGIHVEEEHLEAAEAFSLQLSAVE